MHCLKQTTVSCAKPLCAKIVNKFCQSQNLSYDECFNFGAVLHV